MMKTLRGALWFSLWKQHRLAIAGIFALLFSLVVINGLILNTYFWIFQNPETGIPRSLLENQVFKSSLIPPIPLIEISLFALSLLLLFAICSFTEDRAGKDTSGLCPRLFVLPFSTRQLVYEALLPGALGVVVCFMLWNSLVLTPIGYDWPWLPTLTLIVAAGAGFQALFWSLPSFPGLRVAAIILYGTGFFAWLMRLKEAALPSEEAGLYSLGHLILFVVFTELAVRGVALERRGFWASKGWYSWKLGAAWTRELFPARSRGSRFWTQFRQELRTFSIWPLVWLLVVLALLAANVEWVQRLTADNVEGSKLGMDHTNVASFNVPRLFGFWLPVVGTGLMGLRLARDAASRRYGLSPFMATRPVPAASLLWPKFLLLALLTVVINGACYMCSTVWGDHGKTATSVMVVPSNLRSFLHGHWAIPIRVPGQPLVFQILAGNDAQHAESHMLTSRGNVDHRPQFLSMSPLEAYANEMACQASYQQLLAAHLKKSMRLSMELVIVLVSVYLATLLWPVAFLGVWRRFPWSLFAFMGCASTLAVIYPYLEQCYWSPDYPTLENLLYVANIWLVLAAKLALAGGAFAVAVRRGLMSRNQVGVIALVWLVIAGVLPFVLHSTFLPLWQYVLILLPLGRLPLSVLAIDHARHHG